MSYRRHHLGEHMGHVIRWGILGTGRIARIVAQDFRLVRDAELSAVASRKVGRAQAFARNYGVAKAYGSYEGLLQDRDIDVVYIATPHMRHCDDALACIRAGKAVLCEKSFTLQCARGRSGHSGRSQPWRVLHGGDVDAFYPADTRRENAG